MSDGSRFREAVVAGGNLTGIAAAIDEAKKRWRLSAEIPVVCCYEAGRDGFWICRALLALAIGCIVVDPSSIEVPRRARHAKTDRIDARKLLALLTRRELYGEQLALRPINVPSVEAEDRRQLSRERDRLIEDRTAKVNELKGLLFTQGIRLEHRFDGYRLDVVEAAIKEAKLFDGGRLGANLTARLLRILLVIKSLCAQLDAVEAQRATELRAGRHESPGVAFKLMQLKGVGANCADLFERELFGWRELKNRRQVGAIAGLVPVPFASGDMRQTTGISRAGNRRVRAAVVELAWCWLRYQPNSSLSLWFEERFSDGRRNRRVGIVALARKLLVALWRYLAHGDTPAGAELKQMVVIRG